MEYYQFIQSKLRVKGYFLRGNSYLLRGKYVKQLKSFAYGTTDKARA